MKTTLFFVLGLLVLANATSIEQEFAQIESHPFGQTMLDLVQINMQANSEAGMQTADLFDQINDLVADLQKEMQQDKKGADIAHTDFQLGITQLIEATQATLNQQTKLRVVVKTNLRQNQESLVQAEADFVDAKSHLALVKKAIVDGDKENVRATAAFQTKSMDLTEAVEACKEAVKELSKLAVAKESMIQMDNVKSGMAKVQSTIALHLPQRQMIINPIIQALVDMGTNANPILVAKINGLINQLRSSLEAELKDTVTFEKQRVATYVHDRADLLEDQVATENRIGRDMAQIANYDFQIKENTRIINGLNVSIPVNQQMIAFKNTERSNEQNGYNHDNAIRVDELHVMARLQTYLQTNSDKMSGYLKKRVNAVSQRKF